MDRRTVGKRKETDVEAGQNGIGLGIPEWAGKPPVSTEELYVALREALKLQRHYAELLNMHDGGKRRTDVFASPEAWIARLRETGDLPNAKDPPSPGRKP